MNPEDLLALREAMLNGDYGAVAQLLRGGDGPPEAAQDATAVAPGAMSERFNNPSTTSQIVRTLLSNEPVALSEQEQEKAERVASGQTEMTAVSPLSHALRRLANTRLGRLAGSIGEIAGMNEPHVGPLAAFAGETPMRPVIGRGLASLVDDARRMQRSRSTLGVAENLARNSPEPLWPGTVDQQAADRLRRSLFDPR